MFREYIRTFVSFPANGGCCWPLAVSITAIWFEKLLSGGGIPLKCQIMCITIAILVSWTGITLSCVGALWKAFPKGKYYG